MKKGYYTIHNFMTEELCLTNVPLRVFALIYAFTRDGVGEFNGSRQYVADTIGASKRSVSDAISRLLKDGLIVLLDGTNGKTRVYRVADELIGRHKKGFCDSQEAEASPVVTATVSAKNAPPKTARGEGSDCKGPLQNLHGTLAEIAPNNKYNNKEITNNKSSTTLPREREERKTEEAFSSQGREKGVPANEGLAAALNLPAGKYMIRYYGWDENVPLSAEQYEHLYSLVGRELETYLNKMSDMISSCSERGKYPHSCFRTLLKWIREDFGGIPTDRAALADIRGGVDEGGMPIGEGKKRTKQALPASVRRVGDQTARASSRSASDNSLGVRQKSADRKSASLVNNSSSIADNANPDGKNGSSSPEDNGSSSAYNGDPGGNNDMTCGNNEGASLGKNIGSGIYNSNGGNGNARPADIGTEAERDGNAKGFSARERDMVNPFAGAAFDSYLHSLNKQKAEAQPASAK